MTTPRPRRLLLVDDERVVRELIGPYFAQSGFDVRTSASGAEAIEAGLRFLPDVLVTDWMLDNEVHGLHVSRALQLALPALRTLLITGFPSPDVLEEARAANVGDLVAKPFRPAALLEAVQRVLEGEPAPPGDTAGGLTILRYDERGELLSANGAGGPAAARLGDLFGPSGLEPEAALEQWVGIRGEAARDEQGGPWQVRLRRLVGDGWLAILAPDAAAPHLARTPPVCLLSGEREPRLWAREGRVLVVEDDPLVRRMMLTSLEVAGCACHGAESNAFGLLSFRRDPEVVTVILDWDMPDADVTALVAEMRAHRPEVVVIGTSGLDRADDFRAAGVDLFLAKPWTVRDLLSVVEGRGGESRARGR